jgi:uncharacterized protein YjbJ (UPF0337 family)
VNREQLMGKWKQLRGAARKRWANLTDDDWAHAEGDLDKLVGRIVERYGDAKETVRREVDRLAKEIAAFASEKADKV